MFLESDPRQIDISAKGRENMEKVQALKIKLCEAFPDNLIQISEDVHSFSVFLKDKYKNLEDYVLYQIFIGSSPRIKPNSIFEDLPGEHSVMKFLEDLFDKYKKLKEENK